jgi:hypothetical protein
MKKPINEKSMKIFFFLLITFVICTLSLSFISACVWGDTRCNGNIPERCISADDVQETWTANGMPVCSSGQTCQIFQPDCSILQDPYPHINYCTTAICIQAGQCTPVYSGMVSYCSIDGSVSDGKHYINSWDFNTCIYSKQECVKNTCNNVDQTHSTCTLVAGQQQVVQQDQVIPTNSTNKITILGISMSITVFFILLILFVIFVLPKLGIKF